MVPPAVVSVPVNVVSLVIAGDVTEPPVAGVTKPTPLSIENVFAALAVQESVVEPPVLTVVGFADKVQVGDDGGMTTGG